MRRILINPHRHVIPIPMILFLLLSLLSSCRAGGEPGIGGTEIHRNETSKVGPATGETVYSPRFIDLPLGEGERLLDVMPSDEGYRVLVGKPDTDPSHEYMEPRADMGEFDLFRAYETEVRDFDAAGKLISTTPTFGKSSLNRVETDAGVFESVCVDFFRPPEDNRIMYGFQNLYRDGEEIASPRIYTRSETSVTVIPDGEDVYTFVDGSVVTSADDDLCQVLLINGKKVKLPGLNFVPGRPDIRVSGIMKLGGKVYAVLWEEQYSFIGGVRTLSWQSGVLSELKPGMTALEIDGTKFDGHPNGLCAGLGEKGYYLDGSELYVLENGKSTLLTDLCVLGIEGGLEVRRILPQEDGSVLFVIGGKLVECAMHPVDGTEKTVITLGACLSSMDPDLLLTVRHYNKTDAPYAVTVKEYSDIVALNLALVSGDVALIASNDQLAMRNYARKNLLLPLEEGAPSLLEEGKLIQSIVDASETAGKHFYLPRYFTLLEYRLPRWVMGDRKDFSDLGEFLRFLEEKGATGSMLDATSMTTFRLFLENLDDWVDWKENKAHFTDGDFAEVMEFCRRYCSLKESDAAAFWEANQSVRQLRLGTEEITERVQLEQRENYSEEEWEELPVYFPLPAKSHQGTQIRTAWLMGIVADEKTREGAKDFMEFVFLEDLPDHFEHDGTDWRIYGKTPVYTNGFPVNKAECEAYLQCYLDLMKELSEGEGGEEFQYRIPLLEEELALTREAIDKADHIYYCRGEIFDVISEEAARCFAGEITAEKAAEYIENRIQIYLDEQG